MGPELEDWSFDESVRVYLTTRSDPRGGWALKVERDLSGSAYAMKDISYIAVFLAGVIVGVIGMLLLGGYVSR